MDMFSPLQTDYIKDVNLDELIREEREARLCDAKIRLDQYLALYDCVFEDSLEEETQELLLKKRKRKFQILKDAYNQLSVQNQAY